MLIDDDNALSRWRRDIKLTLEQMAKMIPVAPRTYHRYELGQNACPAPIAQRIFEISGGRISPQVMHQIRLDWLKKHRPEKLLSPKHSKTNNERLANGD